MRFLKIVFSFLFLALCKSDWLCKHWFVCVTWVRASLTADTHIKSTLDHHVMHPFHTPLSPSLSLSHSLSSQSSFNEFSPQSKCLFTHWIRGFGTWVVRNLPLPHQKKKWNYYPNKIWNAVKPTSQTNFNEVDSAELRNRSLTTACSLESYRVDAFVYMWGVCVR